VNFGLGKKILSGLDRRTSRPAISSVVYLLFATVDIFSISTGNPGPIHRR
jgi:hypothetical protein